MSGCARTSASAPRSTPGRGGPRRPPGSRGSRRSRRCRHDRRQLAGGDRDHRLVEQRQALVGLPARIEDVALRVGRQREQVRRRRSARRSRSPPPRSRSRRRGRRSPPARTSAGSAGSPARRSRGPRARRAAAGPVQPAAGAPRSSAAARVARHRSTPDLRTARGPVRLRRSRPPSVIIERRRGRWSDLPTLDTAGALGRATTLPPSQLCGYRWSRLRYCVGRAGGAAGRPHRAPPRRANEEPWDLTSSSRIPRTPANRGPRPSRSLRVN